VLISKGEFTFQRGLVLFRCLRVLIYDGGGRDLQALGVFASSRLGRVVKSPHSVCICVCSRLRRVTRPSLQLTLNDITIYQLIFGENSYENSGGDR
jgi:hypothetical protein